MICITLTGVRPYFVICYLLTAGSVTLERVNHMDTLKVVELKKERFGPRKGIEADEVAIRVEDEVPVHSEAGKYAGEKTRMDHRDKLMENPALRGAEVRLLPMRAVLFRLNVAHE